MQKIIDAEKSDFLFDVLGMWLIALPPLTRAVRADQARVPIHSNLTPRGGFLDFVLSHRLVWGVAETGAEQNDALAAR